MSATIKPAKYGCAGRCHTAKPADIARCYACGETRVPLFTRADLVAVAESMRKEGVRVAKMLARHTENEDAAEDIDPAEDVVSWMLGEQKGGG